jgi:drug/metabolite transporter (DMT)-like permease
MSDKKVNYIKHLFSLLLFGMNGTVASKISLSSYEIVFMRTLLGSLFMLAVFLISGKRLGNTDRRDLFFLTLSGVSMGISWMFLYEAFRHVGVGIASLLYYTGPVIIIALSTWLFGERLTPAKLVGFGAVLVGLILLNLNAFQERSTMWGVFCGVMSALTYASMIIFNKKAKSIGGLKNATLQMLISFLTVTVFIGVKQQFIFRIQPTDWLPILLIGILNTGVGCYLFFSSIGHLPVQTVAAFGYMEPLSAILFSILFLHERLRGVQIVGAILILGGAITADVISNKLLRDAPAAQTVADTQSSTEQ